jgi:hypothetical protein
MVAEKIEAALSLQTLALTGGLGTTPQSAARKSLAHYRAGSSRCGLRRSEPVPGKRR